MRRNKYVLFIGIFIIIVIPYWFFIFGLPNCEYQSMIVSSSSIQLVKPESMVFSSWKIPEWVEKYNVSHLFDWTWHKNGEFKRCLTTFIPLLKITPCRTESSIVVNDALEYFQSHSNEGCIVDNVVRLPNINPHPLPRARSLSDTCSSLNINHQWILCNKPQSELDNWLPATKRFITIAVFNAFIDTGHCHPEVPGTVFTERATFHLQRWTKKRCGNNPIINIPQIKDEYHHRELIDSIGNYLQAPGHFAPQQLPRLLRLLATAPSTAKVLVAKGGIADYFIDILIERGIVTRDRIIQYNKDNYPNYFANIVYRSESWPYVDNKDNYHYIHDRTDMQLVHRVMTANKIIPINKQNRIILIKRKDRCARSIIEHSDMFTFMISALNKSKISLNYQIEIFQAQGHIRDHIDLFRRARIIIGPHGAGMMNILWSSPGTHVIEIGYTQGMTLPDMYAQMSLHLEQNYWICKGYGDYTSPIHVDMNDFSYIFNQIINQLEIENKFS